MEGSGQDAFMAPQRHMWVVDLPHDLLSALMYKRFSGAEGLSLRK
jgi:hypothetical protein